MLPVEALHDPRDDRQRDHEDHRADQPIAAADGEMGSQEPAEELCRGHRERDRPENFSTPGEHCKGREIGCEV